MKSLKNRDCWWICWTSGLLEVKVMNLYRGHLYVDKRSSASASLSTDVHPDSHSYRLHVSQCVRLSRDALHAQSLRYHFPSRAKRPEEEEKLQGLRASSSSCRCRCFQVAVLPHSCCVAVLQAVVQAATLSQKSTSDKQNGETRIEPDRTQ